MRKQIVHLKRRSKGRQKTSHRTIFTELLESQLPEEGKAVERLVDERRTIIGAGTQTTADALGRTLFHVIDTPCSLEEIAG